MEIDGSCDRQMLDKFISGWMANSDGSVISVFVVMHSPEKNGASGLLEALNKALDLTGGKYTKLIGVITDGESVPGTTMSGFAHHELQLVDAVLNKIPALRCGKRCRHQKVTATERRRLKPKGF